MLLEINDSCPSVEITANFVMGDKLGENHYNSLLALIRNRVGKTRSGGCIYLSPLRFNNPSRSRLFAFID